MNPSRIRGAPPPTSAAAPTYPLLRCQKDGPHNLTILADTAFGVISHFVLSDVSGRGESRVCTQHEPGGCPIHDERLEWCCFLPVYEHQFHRRAVLRLAPKEYDVLSKVLGIDLKWSNVRVRITANNSGAGRVIEVERIGNTAAWIPLGPHELERTICLVMRCQFVPRQSPVSEDDPSAEVVIPCQ